MTDPRVDPGRDYNRRLRRERLGAVARPLLVYWVFLILMFGAFALAALIDDPGLDGIIALGIFAAITVAGVVVGQVAAILNIRDWVLFLNWAGFWTAGMAFGVFATTVAGSLGVLVFAFVVLFPIFVVGGAWSLRAGRTLFGGWIPLMYATGCAIIMAENDGRVAAWHAGDKWAIWDGFTITVLALGILLFLAYLVAREGHRLALWRRGPRAPLMGTLVESGAARPRLSCMGWLVMGFLALGLTVGSAILAPYLWRTGPGEEDDDDDPPVPQQQDTGQEQPEEPKEEPQKEKSRFTERWEQARGDRMQEAREQLQPQVSQGLDLLSTLLTVLALFLLALLAFWRPVRRILLSRHYERPFFDLPPTTRIRNGWRLVEVAIGDAGLEPRPNEPAASLVLRAGPVLERLSAGKVEVHGLAEAAEIRDRVEYGLGVHPDDVALMERTARWAYHTVWDRMGEWERIKMLYRGI